VAPENRHLREAWTSQTPIFYFLGVAPQRYSDLWPTYVAGWSISELEGRASVVS
jgi:putative restriction endonuclease